MASRAGPEAPRVIALAGPTASGKSAAAMALARRHEAEIVSVDSALVYRGMDIGTAKPSRAERAQVPHHLIDLRDPSQAYSAAEFLDDARRLVREINARGKWTLLVGGTMLYFKAWFEGLDAMPKADTAVRADLEAQAARRGWPALHADLARVDPAAAARLAPGDAQRIQRALEVFRVSGRPWSSFHARGDRDDAAAWADFPLFSLEPADRGWLHQRIAQRFDAMLAAGFLDEVRALRARGDLGPTLPSMRCVGYRQAWQLLDNHGDGDVPMDRLREQGIAATRQLAKRQLTWLRGMPRRRVIECDAPDAVERLLREVERVA
jgi:tRNA dimethylallyltransferase